MKHSIIAAAILALGIVVAALLVFGRYSLVRLDNQRIARMDRWTGKVETYNCFGAMPCSVSRTPSGGENVMNIDENNAVVVNAPFP